ncbi:Peroxisomal hydratase-dehydrogenase-epimerase [Fulvia fulva]|nr:Peroxisomal hydratase-dehydrogenase-epimerase [Fulvia fulva]WPV15486.1 Peroxisomal hydratase-dehydrogenase-epimerase [Fulvia fulva]WPV29840.1 Peroxisomal hydratase-dehydrogenase-epimerase [Fulvia fulva]
MTQLRYDGQVAVITGAGAGLGRAYARFFAARGARVVVNDLGGTFNARGNDRSSKVADQVVEELVKAGGEAVADYNAVQQGDKIIETAIKNYGRVDILVNNAGILRDITLRKMNDGDWDAIADVHLHGAYKTTRAAWPYFKKQKYGRVVHTTSSSGLFGNFGQSNYAAAKFGLVGLTETLAKEGAKYNIHSNVLAPAAASRLTQTVWPKEMMDLMGPEWVVPLVGYLTHSDCKESGSIFEGGAGHFSKIRWERSKGLLLKPDENLHPEHVLAGWSKITDFTLNEHPQDPADLNAMLSAAERQSPNKPLTTDLGIKGRVALVTGGGAGLGRAYAFQLAKLGAKVMVNDVQNAHAVAEEIKAQGLEAQACDISVERGDVVVKAVIDAFGRIDLVVNNAGILRDKAFANMTDTQWHQVINCHLRGTYKITRAAFPYMVKQKYGRIVNITSTSGIYGNFGQANYSAAKAAVLGFTKSTAREGAKYNVFVNVVAPSAGTDMTRTIWPEAAVQSLKPDYVAPLVAVLLSEKPPANGIIFEAGGGWFASTRWQRARGVDFDFKKGIDALTVEMVAEAFPKIIAFDNKADYPESPADGVTYTSGNAINSGMIKDISQEERTNRKWLSAQQKAMESKSSPSTYSYDERDVILYNLGVGAKRNDLNLVFEGANNFGVLPTFGVIPTYFSKAAWSYKDIVPNFDMRQLLHGEQYLEILQWPIPTEATLTTTPKLIEVVDKGNAAVVRSRNETTDASGKLLFVNEGVTFIRKAGNFGGQKKPSDRGAATADNNPPSRNADRIVEEKTSEDLAAIYRLMGDRNPLHIDPEFSKVGGFETPILHGLASFGITGKHVFQSYGPVKSIKVRFAGVVLPGQTIFTEMWKEGGKVIYRAKVKETGKLCISNAAAELRDEKAKL